MAAAVSGWSAPETLYQPQDESNHMPLLKIDLYEGRSDAQLQQLLDTMHDVMVKAFKVPVRDRYQIVNFNIGRRAWSWRARAGSISRARRIS